MLIVDWVLTFLIFSNLQAFAKRPFMSNFQVSCLLKGLPNLFRDSSNMNCAVKKMLLRYLELNIS